MRRILEIITCHPRLLALGISFGITFALPLATGVVTPQDVLAKGWEEGYR